MDFLDLQYSFDDMQIAGELIRVIEEDYGMSIVRVPFFERTLEPYTFSLKIIFVDYTLLEATIKVFPFYDMGTVKVEGIYY